MPRPAVIHCTPPGPVTNVSPVESLCATWPSNTNVSVSKPLWGCGPNGNPPLLGGYTCGPWWFKKRNGFKDCSDPVGSARNVTKSAMGVSMAG